MKAATAARLGCWLSQRGPLQHSNVWDKMISKGFLQLRFLWFI